MDGVRSSLAVGDDDPRSKANGMVEAGGEGELATLPTRWESWELSFVVVEYVFLLQAVCPRCYADIDGKVFESERESSVDSDIVGNIKMPKQCLQHAHMDWVMNLGPSLSIRLGGWVV
jgi:hypothetical protein